MAGAMHKAMVYLGLAEADDRFEAYDAEEDARDDRDRERAAGRPARTGAHVEHVEGDEERNDRIERGEREHRADVTHLPRRVPMSQVVSDVEVSGVNRITTIHPRTYNDAKSIGEAFREATPVIMNLTDLDDADAKRLVDFAAGLVFGLQGTIERVTNKVFLLSPAHVEVTSDDGEPTKNHKKLFNQS